MTITASVPNSFLNGTIDYHSSGREALPSGLGSLRHYGQAEPRQPVQDDRNAGGGRDRNTDGHEYPRMGCTIGKSRQDCPIDRSRNDAPQIVTNRKPQPGSGGGNNPPPGLPGQASVAALSGPIINGINSRSIRCLSANRPLRRRSITSRPVRLYHSF